MNTNNIIARVAAPFLVVAAIVLSASGQARAAFVSCAGDGYDISERVPTAIACSVLAPLDGEENDTPMPGFVNDAGFFGMTDWVFDGRWSSVDGSFVNTSSLFRFDVSGDGSSGAFSYVGDEGIHDILFVFKDGAGTNLVGYLLRAGSGTYRTPFVSPPFALPDDAADEELSHISVYYRGGQTPRLHIPEPGILVLLGVSALGLRWTRRRAR